MKYEKDILLSSSRAFSLSTDTFSLSTPVENSEASWKKATKCNKCKRVLLCDSSIAQPTKIGRQLFNNYGRKAFKIVFR